MTDEDKEAITEIENLSSEEGLAEGCQVPSARLQPPTETPNTESQADGSVDTSKGYQPSSVRSSQSSETSSRDKGKEK